MKDPQKTSLGVAGATVAGGAAGYTLGKRKAVEGAEDHITDVLHRTAARSRKGAKRVNLPTAMTEDVVKKIKALHVKNMSRKYGIVGATLGGISAAGYYGVKSAIGNSNDSHRKSAQLTEYVKDGFSFDQALELIDL